MAAASAVADSLPFDKHTTKSDLLKQLQQHEEELRAQKAREKRKIRSVVRCHVSQCPVHGTHLCYIQNPPHGPAR